MRLSRSQSVRCCWPLRAIRGARPDRNPLRRGIDRLETCLLVGLFVALAAVTPFAARLAGHASYVSASHARQEQLADRHQVRAVLSEDAGPVGGYALSAYVLTEATWTSVTGVRREAGSWLLVSGEPHRALPALIAALQARNLPLERLATRQATLDDVFVSLTGRSLRDDSPASAAAAELDAES